MGGKRTPEAQQLTAGIISLIYLGACDSSFAHRDRWFGCSDDVPDCHFSAARIWDCWGQVFVAASPVNSGALTYAKLTHRGAVAT